MPTNKDPKVALDSIIKKSRVHLYKPIQIAEILYRARTEKGWHLNDLESYRNISKRWRDEVSSLLVGRRSTSSQRFQDNLFEANAMPPKVLLELSEINKINGGMVEAYIYAALEKRLLCVYEVEKYIEESDADSFSLMHLVSLFQSNPGLRRSIDKMYEILVYALFSTIVRVLGAKITIEIENEDEEILKDFEEFIRTVLGIDSEKRKLVLPAALYRVGVTNAADRGLDMWGNFGAAIQVKHLTMTPELVEDIADGISADRIVIVCVDSEKQAIKTLLTQVGWGERIQGIITISDLDNWYKLCLNSKYRQTLGKNLLADVQREFNNEFPSSLEIKPFMESRNYHNMAMPKGWETI